MPILQGESPSNETTHERKKKYTRRMSEIKTVSHEISSPKSSKSGNISGVIKDQSRGLRGSRNSW